MRVLLISTYDLGRQPFGLASAAAALDARRVDVCCLDLSKQALDPALVAAADSVAFYLPMHTATRLAQPVIDRVRALNPAARLCAYGLYAPLNAEWLRAAGVEAIIGGEFEDDLAAWAVGEATGDEGRRVARDRSIDSDCIQAGAPAPRMEVPRVQFRVPLRASLPPLERYATLVIGEERRTAGHTEASRGCKHRCRHCPIVPVYDGRFRILPVPIVLADIRAQVAAGAQHISFGDPDFFNGITHAVAVIRAFALEFPAVTYDVTIKIEHLLIHADHLPLLRATGCLFITSAVEAVDDLVLGKLEKGHTRADFERVVALCREAGLVLAPTFVPFTPWTTVRGYCALLQTIEALDLVGQVAPIQLAIRLLIPAGSRLLELEEIRDLVGPFSPRSLAYPWRHPDPDVDRLQEAVAQLVGGEQGTDRATLFCEIWSVAHQAAGVAAPPPRDGRHAGDQGAALTTAIPRISEPWYCCAEPAPEHGSVI